MFEQFLRLKAKLEAEGLFDPAHKRALPEQPRAIGVVTSLGAAAWHDVVTALQRRVPQIPVIMAPALVQGAGAAATLVQALQNMYALTAEDNPLAPPVDVILLVRGGGSMEDLWSFNDEALVRAIVRLARDLDLEPLEREQAASGHRIERVDAQVEKHLMNLGGVREHGPQFTR